MTTLFGGDASDARSHSRSFISYSNSFTLSSSVSELKSDSRNIAPRIGAEACQHNSPLPTPPSSTRPSLESATELSVTNPALIEHAVLPRPLSPPPSPPVSPVVTTPLDGLLDGVCRVLDGHSRSFKSNNVTHKMYEELEARVSEMPGWEGIQYVSTTLLFNLVLTGFFSIDFNGKDLIIQYPGFGHEIMESLWNKVEQSNSDFFAKPTVRKASILELGGSTDVELADGVKSPDFSLYVIDPEAETQKDVDGNCDPVVTFEVAHAENAKKLSMDAARQVLFSKGQILLVVALKVKVNRHHPARELEEVTWAHWEMDWGYMKRVDSGWTGKLNNPVPDGENNPGVPPNSYVAVVEIADVRYHVRAFRSEEFKVSFRSGSLQTQLLIIDVLRSIRYLMECPSMTCIFTFSGIISKGIRTTKTMRWTTIRLLYQSSTPTSSMLSICMRRFRGTS